MFGISLPEVMLILVIIIIFVRPEDLPKFLRSAGRFYGKAKRMYKEIIGVTNQVMKEMNSIASLDDPPASGTAKKTAPQTPAVTQPPAAAPVDMPAKDPDALLSSPDGLLNVPADDLLTNTPADLITAEPVSLTPPESIPVIAESEIDKNGNVQ